jgi:hypothetical protein
VGADPHHPVRVPGAQHGTHAAPLFVTVRCADCGADQVLTDPSPDELDRLNAATDYEELRQERTMLLRARALFDRFPSSRDPVLLSVLEPAPPEGTHDPEFTAALAEDPELEMFLAHRSFLLPARLAGVEKAFRAMEPRVGHGGRACHACGTGLLVVPEQSLGWFRTRTMPRAGSPARAWRRILFAGRKLRDYDWPGHHGVLHSRPWSWGMVKYLHTLSVFKHGRSRPSQVVAAEYTGKSRAGRPIFLGVFVGDSHHNLGSSDEWADLERFTTRAVEIARETFEFAGEGSA